MIRRPPRSTLDRSSAASDVYKRQVPSPHLRHRGPPVGVLPSHVGAERDRVPGVAVRAVSYTHLRAHETVLDLVCRLLLEKKKKHITEDDTFSYNRNQDTPHVIIRRATTVITTTVN